MGEGSYITLFSPSDVTAFHSRGYGEGVLYNLVFTERRHCVSQNQAAFKTGLQYTHHMPVDLSDG